MAERFEEISPVSENPECLSTDIGLPVHHQGDSQHPPTKDTPGCDVLTVHPHQGLDKERVEAVAQDQDGCRSQLHPSDVPPVKPEESPDMAHPTEDGEDEALHQPHERAVRPDQGLSVAPDPSGGPTQALPGEASDRARGYSTADAGGSGGRHPALVITQAEERLCFRH
ncbi:unnamed protein product [Arctogadus glacialis]